jgi:hypothetical protein
MHPRSIGGKGNTREPGKCRRMEPQQPELRYGRLQDAWITEVSSPRPRINKELQMFKKQNNLSFDNSLK